MRSLLPPLPLDFLLLLEGELFVAATHLYSPYTAAEHSMPSVDRR